MKRLTHLLFLLFIIRVITANFFMKVMRRSTVDWHCFKNDFNDDLQDSNSVFSTKSIYLRKSVVSFHKLYVYRKTSVSANSSKYWITFERKNYPRSLISTNRSIIFFSKDFDIENSITRRDQRFVVKKSNARQESPRVRRRHIVTIIQQDSRLTEAEFLHTSKVSFTFVKSTKRWSRGLFKIEIRRRDTCVESTVSRLISWLTDSSWSQK